LDIAQAKQDTVTNKESVTLDSTINQSNQPLSTIKNNGLAGNLNTDSDKKLPVQSNGRQNDQTQFTFLSTEEIKTDNVVSAPVVTVPDKNLSDRKDLASGATKINDQDIKREKSKKLPAGQKNRNLKDIVKNQYWQMMT
jgi:hypothetical protein